MTYSIDENELESAPISSWPSVCLGASITIIVGSLGPWASVIDIKKSGIQGDGVITLIIGAVAGLLCFALVHRNGSPLLGDVYILPLLGLAAAAVALFDIFNVSRLKSEFLGATVQPTVEWSLLLLLAGALTLLSASIFSAKNYRSAV